MSIKVEQLGYTYSIKTPFEHKALSDINLEIKDGSFTFIVGKTGCGKSTLIQQFNGLLVPTTGKITIGEFIISSDKKIKTKKLSPLRKKVGIVFQFSEYQLFEESVEEDVSFGPRNFNINKTDALNIAHDCLKQVGMNESYFNRSPFELSGGEKRRVAIAGILALQPDVLVLDEPTAGLDPLGTIDMMNLFKKLNENGTTIIVVTHDMNLVVEYASDVIIMSDGKVIKHTSPSNLFLDDYEKYSLETPLIYKFVKKLKDKGLDLDYTKIRDISSLCDEIKKGSKVNE